MKKFILVFLLLIILFGSPLCAAYYYKEKHNLTDKQMINLAKYYSTKGLIYLIYWKKQVPTLMENDYTTYDLMEYRKKIVQEKLNSMSDDEYVKLLFDKIARNEIALNQQEKNKIAKLQEELNLTNNSENLKSKNETMRKIKEKLGSLALDDEKTVNELFKYLKKKKDDPKQGAKEKVNEPELVKESPDPSTNVNPEKVSDENNDQTSNVPKGRSDKINKKIERAQKAYDEGVVHYKKSFEKDEDMFKELRIAFDLFKESCNLLDEILDEDPSLEDELIPLLRKASDLRADCFKRGR